MTRVAGGRALEERANRTARSVSMDAPVRGAMPGTATAPLTPEQRAHFEPRFGWDFTSVRVHSDQSAADAARQRGARAFTSGSDIYFGAREDGPELLAHELAHVVQQATIPGLSGAVQLQPVPAPKAAPAAEFVHKAKGFAIAKYTVSGIDFRLGVLIPQLPAMELLLNELAAEIARGNASITDPAAQVKLCAIGPTSGSRLATHKGAPLLILNSTGAVDVDTVRHEMGHAIFDFHRSQSGDPKSKVKDAPLILADIYARLAATKLVEAIERDTAGVETKKTRPAGLWLADPGQWSSVASEHPWDDADELFASARNAFLTNKAALRKSIARFTRMDKAVAKPAADLLAAVEQLSKGKAPRAPAKYSADARSELARIRMPGVFAPNTITPALGWALDPSTIPGQSPSTIPGQSP